MAAHKYIEVTARVHTPETGVWCDFCSVPSVVRIPVAIFCNQPGVEPTAEQRATPIGIYVMEGCGQPGCPRFMPELSDFS